MRIVIYNTNSFGGNYNYSLKLAKAYTLQQEIESCLVLSPPSRNDQSSRVTDNFLLSDKSAYSNPVLRKLYFIYRSFINPIRLLRFLKKYPAAVVLFNDYDQMSAPLWAPFFKNLKKRHLFAVILHDPDRDSYFPVKKLSAWTMERFMDIIDVAFYHEILPDRSYYDKVSAKVMVPHGIYFQSQTDLELQESIRKSSKGKFIVSILGNIRKEKNYELAIAALENLPEVMLLVAGSPANSRVDLQEYQYLIEKYNLTERVLWIDRFLTEAELHAAITASDLILMCYKPGFTSQSGILNLIAPHKKNIVVGDSSSALQKTVVDFKIGRVIPLNKKALVDAITHFQNHPDRLEEAWNVYLDYASWERHADIAMNVFKLKNPGLN